MISKKSARFEVWLQDGNDDKNKLLVALELAARLAIHDFDQQGEMTPANIQALARAVKKLEAEYVK